MIELAPGNSPDRSSLMTIMQMKGRFPTLLTEGKEMAEEEPCAVDVTLRVIGGRWKVLILQDLFTGTRRFSEIYRAVHGITQKMLAQQLREMERHGIVNRLVYAEVPPKVEYSLTPPGEESLARPHGDAQMGAGAIGGDGEPGAGHPGERTASGGSSRAVRKAGARFGEKKGSPEEECPQGTGKGMTS